MTKPKNIEAVVTVIIYNDNKEVLYIQDPKWDNVWTYPGGHIEYGEKIFDAALREINEEVGIPLEDMKAELIIGSGEKISSKHLHHSAHFIYSTVVCKTSNTDLNISKREVSDYKWLKPVKALESLNLGPNDTKSTKKFIEYLNKY